ncbi:MAG: hypothetical protein IAF08_03935 [Rhizobacter sp.]|nr:hypothetical protein [Chlorobiales bacterium]
MLEGTSVAAFMALSIPIISIAGVLALLWKRNETQHRERVMMIEKGMSPDMFESPTKKHFRAEHPLVSLEWGMVSSFVGLGLLVASMLNRFAGLDNEIFVACMLVSGGIGLILFYFIAAKKLKEEVLNQP